MVGSAPLDDEAVAALADASHVEFERETARWSGRRGELCERDGVLLIAAASDFPVSMNAAMRLDRSSPASAVLDLAEAWFGERGLGYSLRTSGLGEGDADLIAEAEARGLLHLMDIPAMVYEAPLPTRSAPEGVEPRWAESADDIAAFVAINDAAYQSLGMTAGVIADSILDLDRVLAPHVRTVIAWQGEEPLAAPQVLLSHGIAGVYYVGTVETARGCGLADLVTRTVTYEGFDRGAAFVTLQASTMGDPIYPRMGAARSSATPRTPASSELERRDARCVYGARGRSVRHLVRSALHGDKGARAM